MIKCQSLIELKKQEGGHNSGIEKKLVTIMTLKESKLQRNTFLLLVVSTFFLLEKSNVFNLASVFPVKPIWYR